MDLGFEVFTVRLAHVRNYQEKLSEHMFYWRKTWPERLTWGGGNVMVRPSVDGAKKTVSVHSKELGLYLGVLNMGV
jgi:hypothetical protein